MTSPTKFRLMNQIILSMWSSDQSLVTLAFGKENVIITSILQGFDEKNHFFCGVVLVQVQ